MALLLDVFGFLSVLLQGARLTAQSLTLGGIAFLACLARPLASVMAGFPAVRADPEVWPGGPVGVFESLRDSEVVQHRLFALLIVLFALFEWRVRTGRIGSAKAALVFPLLSSIGGGLLLTHSHALGNLRDQVLIEITHVPLALFGIAAGWARWLELRLAPPGSRIAGWTWPICFVSVGILLLLYRES